MDEFYEPDYQKNASKSAGIMLRKNCVESNPVHTHFAVLGDMRMVGLNAKS